MRDDSLKSENLSNLDSSLGNDDSLDWAKKAYLQLIKSKLTIH